MASDSDQKGEMDRMKKNERKVLLKQLNARKAEFEEALDRLIRSQRDLNDQQASDNYADESDIALREVQVLNNYSLIEKKTKELQNIRRLTQMLSKDENFGTCEECGNPIPVARLMIVPETSLCVTCQRAMEKSDQMRNLAGRAAMGYRGRPEASWEELSTTDDSEYGLMDSEMDVFPMADPEEAEGTESFEES
jgi:DnaK suppressor protein